jgi:hypothetical protein
VLAMRFESLKNKGGDSQPPSFTKNLKILIVTLINCNNLINKALSNQIQFISVVTHVKQAFGKQTEVGTTKKIKIQNINKINK